MKGLSPTKYLEDGNMQIKLEIETHREASSSEWIQKW